MARLAPAKLPAPEPDALVMAVLPVSRVRALLNPVGEAIPLMIAVVGTLVLLATVFLQSPALAVTAFAAAATADWVASGPEGRFASLLRLAGWGGPLRSLIRWLLLAAAIDQPALVVMALTCQAAAAAASVTTLWLQQRQPVLEFVPGAPAQPPSTVAFARVYRRSASWPGMLLVIEVAGALLALSGGWWLALPMLAAASYAGLVLLDASRLARSTGALEARTHARLEALQPTSLVYVSGGIGQAKYLYNQWTDAFAALPSPPLVVVREASQLASLASAAGPVLYAPASRNVESVCVASVRLAFYLANGQKNGDLWRNQAVAHVFLGHGDSDKATSASPIAKVYDQIWVAGPAAIERYARAGVEVDPSAFVVVGRPQTAVLPVGATGHPRPVILYAPTFEGYAEATNYSSLQSMGHKLVAAILEHRPDAVVWFRPHPSTGVQRADIRAAREQVNALLRVAGTPHRVLDDEPSETLMQSMSEADVLITDVSSLSSDFLQTERPIIVTDPAGLGAQLFVEQFPSQRASYRLDRELTRLPTVLAEALGHDPLAPARRELKKWILGDLPEGPVAAFAAAAERLATMTDPATEKTTDRTDH